MKNGAPRKTFASLAALLALCSCASAAAAQNTTPRAGAATPSSAPLTEAEVGTARRVLKVFGGRPDQVLGILENERVTLARLEQVLSVIYVLLVEIKYEEVKEHGDCCLGRSGEVKEWLTETKVRLDSYITQYFGGRSRQYKDARKLVRAYRAELSPVLYLAICQER